MAQLTLQFKDLALKEFELTGQSMTMGREPDNDIVVENLLVLWLPCSYRFLQAENTS